jgi:hypothetical protein
MITPDPTAGGTVVALLLQKAMRLRNTNVLLDMQGDYVAPKVFVGAIPVSVKTQETYKLSAAVTQHAIESGALVQDHIILQPIGLDLVFEVTNWDASLSWYTTKLFEDLWRSRTPIELLTKTSTLRNMVMTSFSSDNSVPNWGAITCRASFQQITLVTPDKVLLPTKVAPTAKTGGPDTKKSAEAPEPNRSVAKGAVKKVDEGLDAIKNVLKNSAWGR